MSITLCRFTRDYSIEKEEVNFVNSIHGSVDITPGLIPSWLWDASTIDRHHTFELQVTFGYNTFVALYP